MLEKKGFPRDSEASHLPELNWKPPVYKTEVLNRELSGESTDLSSDSAGSSIAVHHNQSCLFPGRLLPSRRFWCLARDGDVEGFALARRHYSADKNRHPRIRRFVGSGQRMVLISPRRRCSIRLAEVHRRLRPVRHQLRDFTFGGGRAKRQVGRVVWPVLRSVKRLPAKEATMNLTTAQARKLGIRVPTDRVPPELHLRRLAKTSMRPGDSVNSAIRPRVDPGVLSLSLFVDVKALNTLNRREHWRVKQQRAKEQRSRTFAAIKTAEPIPPLPVLVTLCRRYKGLPCDDDGLSASLKHVRDGAADCYGIEDNDPRIRFEYEQEPVKRGEPWSVRVFISTDNE
jgi:hypothetical protein